MVFKVGDLVIPLCDSLPLRRFFKIKINIYVSVLFIQLNAQLDYSKLKLALKFILKRSLHVSVNKTSSGSLLPCLAKVMIIKIVSFGCICSHTTELNL
jgi:hypothetical protein